MRKYLLLLPVVAAILVPTGLAADPVPGDFKNAATYCKALGTAKGVEVFRTQVGTNKNKHNAFGKCVSATAKAKAKAAKKDDDENENESATEAKANAACKKQQSENATKFAQDHKNFGQCVKAEQARA